MTDDRKEFIFNACVIIASLFILVSGQLFAQAMIYLLIQIFGILLITWALITIKVSKNHHKHPLPNGSFFLTHGPYEIIRHPIYAGFLLIMVSFVEIEFTFLRLIALAILCTALFLKIVREEYILSQEIKEYK